MKESPHEVILVDDISSENGTKYDLQGLSRRAIASPKSDLWISNVLVVIDFDEAYVL